MPQVCNNYLESPSALPGMYGSGKTTTTPRRRLPVLVGPLAPTTRSRCATRAPRSPLALAWEICSVGGPLESESDEKLGCFALIGGTTCWEVKQNESFWWTPAKTNNGWCAGSVCFDWCCTWDTSTPKPLLRCELQRHFHLRKFLNYLSEIFIWGRQKKRWEDNTAEWTHMELSEAMRTAEDKDGWREQVNRSAVVPQDPPGLWDRLFQTGLDNSQCLSRGSNYLIVHMKLTKMYQNLRSCELYLRFCNVCDPLKI